MSAPKRFVAYCGVCGGQWSVDDDPEFSDPGPHPDCPRRDRTIDIGYVHVGRPVGPRAPMDGKWVCADTCPHPDHATGSEAGPDSSAETSAAPAAPMPPLLPRDFGRWLGPWRITTAFETEPWPSLDGWDVDIWIRDYREVSHCEREGCCELDGIQFGPELSRRRSNLALPISDHPR
jgi:hypothetical protein